MQLTLTIKMDNAAFGDYADSRGYETASIIEDFAAKLRNSGASEGRTGKLYDTNGNAVGTWEVTS